MENSQLITIITENDEIFQFQGIVSYAGNDTSTLTSYPTSEGTPRTDNIYNNPNKFTCSISIGGSENVSDEWGEGTDRPKNAGLILTKWKEDAIALTITTNQKDYFNMFLVGISPQNNVNNSYDYVAGLEFNELRIANFTTETIEVSSQYSYSVSQDQSVDTSTDMAVGVGGTLGYIGAFAGTGAVIGGVLGTIVPGAGTLAGIGIGAAAGAVVGVIGAGIHHLGRVLGWE